MSLSLIVIILIDLLQFKQKKTKVKLTRRKVEVSAVRGRINSLKSNDNISYISASMDRWLNVFPISAALITSYHQRRTNDNTFSICFDHLAYNLQKIHNQLCFFFGLLFRFSLIARFFKFSNSNVNFKVCNIFFV